MKPYIICHMMTTLDGKINSGKEGFDILNEYFPLYLKTENEMGGDAWMCGRVTMEAFAENKNTQLLESNIKLNTEADNIYKDSNNSRFIFGVDTRGILRWKDNSIKLSNVPDKLHLVIIVTKKTPKAYLEYLQQKNISYIFGGEDEINFQIIFDKIASIFKVQKLLLEGGGILNGSVLSQNFIDEISLLILPEVLNNSNANSIFEHKSEKVDLRKFKLIDHKRLELDTIWLRYLRR